MAWDDFERIAIGAIKKNRKSMDAWARKVQGSPESLADILFRVGVIGLSKEVTVSPYFCNGRSFAETWVLVSPKPVVHIHAGFAKSLDVSEIGRLVLFRVAGGRERLVQSNCPLRDCCRRVSMAVGCENSEWWTNAECPMHVWPAEQCRPGVAGGWGRRYSGCVCPRSSADRAPASGAGGGRSSRPGGMPLQHTWRVGGIGTAVVGCGTGMAGAR